jgi:transcriptional regulator with XRE-family HTH domain
MEPNDTTPRTFGQRMRSAREAAGLTQNQVATYADLSQSGLSQIEADQCSPSIDTFRRLLLVYIANTPSILGRGEIRSPLLAEQLLYGLVGYELLTLARSRFGPEEPVPEDV